MHSPVASTPPRKAIPPTRDRLQSWVLVWTVVPLLCVAAALIAVADILDTKQNLVPLLTAIAISVVFAVLAWHLKAATATASACGGLICLLLTLFPRYSGTPFHTGLTPLITLFVITYSATRSGSSRKTNAGLAESRKGRSVSQVVANLGIGALLAFPFGGLIVLTFWHLEYYLGLDWVIMTMVLSALAEATSDTVSSEIGQAFGGTPFLVTTFARVPPGTDGGISLLGTLAGVFSGAAVTAVGAWSVHLPLAHATLALAAGMAGLWFDSLLGATLERRGWIGNDFVNFFSTAFAAILSLTVMLLIPNIGPHPAAVR